MIALLERVYGTNGMPTVKTQQLEAYLKENHRSAASLLAASRLTGDRALLREAMEKFPNDPRVAFDAYYRSEVNDRTKPADEERRKWLEALKQSDPGNALADYLAARDDFLAGRTEAALQEIQTASGKSTFQDYSLDFLQNSEEALRAAGYSDLAAKVSATWNLPLPQLYDLKQVGVSLTDLAKQYQQAGDTASAQAALQMAMTLGDRFSGPGQWPLINTLVGMAVQKIALGAMDPSALYGDSGKTVQQQIAAIDEQRAAIRVLTKQSDAFQSTISDSELTGYFDRIRIFGERAAMQWLVDRHAQP